MEKKYNLIFFIIIFSLALFTIVYSFNLIRKNKTYTDEQINNGREEITRVEETIHVEDFNYQATKGNQPSKVNSTYLMALDCPKGYGVSNVVCKSMEPERNDIKLLGASRNTEGPLCVFEAAKPFIGGISADCVKDLRNIPVYKAEEFSPGIHSEIPTLFEIWQSQQMVKGENGRYTVSLECPSGYKASNVMCLLNTPINYGGVVLQHLGVSSNGDIQKGECEYSSDSSYKVTVRVQCSK